jgi:hypothetical protein
MAQVSPLTNAVNENIEQALADIRGGCFISSTITLMVLRDVDAMMKGGPEQGQHIIDCGQAWLGESVVWVGVTYREFHEAYKAGWLQIAEGLGRRFYGERELDDVVRLQTSIVENIAMQGKNKALRSVEEDATGLSRALVLLFENSTTV